MYSYLLTQIILKRKRIARLFALGKGRNYTPFVILGAPRTGSTLLHTYLNSHPGIYSRGEFPREQIEAGNAITLAHHVFTPQPKRTVALGCKLFHSYAGHAQYRDMMEELRAMPQVKVIWIDRQDKLSAYISMLLAQQSGNWNDRKKMASAPRIRIQREAFETYCEQWRQDLQWAKEALSSHDTYALSYEELTTTSEKVLREVQQFLGVPVRSLFSLLVKQNPEPIHELVENAAEAVLWWEEIRDQIHA